MNPLPRRAALVWLIGLLCFSCVGLGWFAAQVAEHADAWLMLAYFGLMGAGSAIGVLRHSSPR